MNYTKCHVHFEACHALWLQPISDQGCHSAAITEEKKLAHRGKSIIFMMNRWEI